MRISHAHDVQLRQLMLCKYPDCVKNTQELNEHGYTVPGTHWNTQYPDCVRNIHVVNGRSYTVPGTH